VASAPAGRHKESTQTLRKGASFAYPPELGDVLLAGLVVGTVDVYEAMRGGSRQGALEDENEGERARA